MQAWFATAVGSASELDYSEALDWYGLEMKRAVSGEKETWTLAIAADADALQRSRMLDWLSTDGQPAPP